MKQTGPSGTNDLPTTKYLLQAAGKLGISHRLIDQSGLLRLSKDNQSAHIFRTKFSINNLAGAAVSHNKHLAGKILRSHNLPCPEYQICHSLKSVQALAQNINYPLVVKPNAGSQGLGVTIKISSQRELIAAAKLAFKYSPSIVISPFFPGIDYRLLVLRNQVIGAVRKEPPTINGDGKKTINQLINLENSRRKQLNRKRSTPLKYIKLDREIQRLLRHQNLNPDSILPPGRSLPLRLNANWSTGGTAQTVNINKFHPEIVQTAVKAAKLMTLDFAGIDFLLKTPAGPLKNNGIILEVNSSPAIGIFHQPTAGQPQEVAPLILLSMFNPD